MIEYDIEWEEYNIYLRTGHIIGSGPKPPQLPKIKKGNTLRPKTVPPLTGCGIVLFVQDVPECRRSMYSNTTQDWSYLVSFMTDFGNILMLTDKEVLNNYEVTGIDTDIEGRIETQIGKLRKALQGV